MATLHYLAFGSNLHPLRLGERVPSARLVGRVELAGYRLVFHKRGQDGSGKGNLVRTEDGRGTAVAALFEIDAAERPALDAAEGPGYRTEAIRVAWGDRTMEAFIYLGETSHVDPGLRPFRWYRDLVWHGARYHEASDAYLAQIAAVATIEDPDPERRARNEALVERIRATG